MTPAVWSYSEVDSVAREMFTAAKDLAKALSAELLLVRTDRAQPGNGSGKTLLVRGDGEVGGSAALVAEALARAATRRHPSVILVGSTRMGRMIAAKLGAKLKMGCLCDVYHLRTDGSSLFGDRSVYSGKVTAQVKASLPCVATVKAGAYPQAADGNGALEVEEVGAFSDGVEITKETGS